MKILDSTGTGNGAKVDVNKRLHTQATTETESLHATEIGTGYNLNTGSITFTCCSCCSAGTLIYLKNNECLEIVVEAIAIGVGDGSVANIGELTLIRNPTGGDLICDATAVSMNANRNFSSNQTLCACVFKGKTAGTITGGTDVALFYQADNGRLFAPIDLVIPKGSSVALKYDPKLSSGSVKVYGALIVHLKDNAAKD